MNMERKKMYEKWIPLTKEQENLILLDFDKGRTRTLTLREYKITEDQYCYIVRKASISANGI